MPMPTAHASALAAVLLLAAAPEPVHTQTKRWSKGMITFDWGKGVRRDCYR